MRSSQMKPAWSARVFAWVGGARLTLGEVWRRLPQAGERTRTGQTVWDRRVVWGLLKHPASQGAAALGKTRLEPLRPRRRAQRHRPVQPRRAVSVRDVPPEDWSTLPVPALVEPAVCAAVQEQWQEHTRHARHQSRRGALSLLPGLRQGQHWGYAFDGKRLSPRARKGQPRASASDRCLGTDAYRFGGERLCQHTQVRTDLLDLAVGQEVCPLLAHPARLAEDYRRRLQPETHAKRPSRATVEGHRRQGRQGIARLIDSEAESLIDQHEFEPRMTRLRQRLARLEEQRPALAEEAARPGALPLMIGRLEDGTAKRHSGLEGADGASQRDLIRALVKRGEVAQNDVNIVFRIDPYPGDNDPEKKVGNFVGGEVSPVLAHVFLHSVLDVWLEKVVQRHGRGEACLLRSADDFVCACEDPAEAERFYNVLGQRVGQGGLARSGAKTRRLPLRRHRRAGPTSCECLGGALRWGQERKGREHRKRRPARKKRRTSLRRCTAWGKEHRPLRLPVLCQRLHANRRGDANYYGVHGNAARLKACCKKAMRIVWKWLNRCRQRHRDPWQGYPDVLERFHVARPRIVGRPKTRPTALKPCANMRQRVFLKSPVRENRTPGSVRGRLGNWPSYRDVFCKKCKHFLLRHTSADRF